MKICFNLIDALCELKWSDTHSRQDELDKLDDLNEPDELEE